MRHIYQKLAYPSYTDKIILFICFIIWAFFSFLAVDLYQEDEVVHYLIAKYSWQHPLLFLDIWGRPLVTLLFSIPAQVNLGLARFLSSLTSLIVAYLTIYLAEIVLKKNEVRLVIPFLVFQPFYFLLSFGILTELIFSLVFILWLIFVYKKRYALATLFIALTPLARPEGFFFIILWAFIILFNPNLLVLTRIFLMVMSGIVVILWNTAGFLTSSDPLWLLHSFPWGGQQAYYGSGSPFYYILLLPIITGIGAFPFFVYGLFNLIKNNKFLLPGIFFFFLILHTILWTFGLFRSAGLLRYFVCISPVIAIICIVGYRKIIDIIDSKAENATVCQMSLQEVPSYELTKQSQSSKGRLCGLRAGKFDIAIVFVGALTCVIITFWYNPFRLSLSHQTISDAYAWYENYKRSNTIPEIFCSSFFFFLLAGEDRFDYERFPPPTYENLQKAKLGSVMIWDSRFSPKEAGLPLKVFPELGYKEIARFQRTEIQKRIRLIIASWLYHFNINVIKGDQIGNLEETVVIFLKTH